MRSLMTMTGVLAATLMACQPSATNAQDQNGPDNRRIIRRSGQQGPTSNGGQRAAVRRRVIRQMREGAENQHNGQGVWTRDFPEPAAYPVTLDELPDSFTLSNVSGDMLRIETSVSMYSSTECEVEWSCAPADSGVDITYTIANNTSSIQPMPTLQIDGLNLGDVIEYLDHRTGCKWATLDATGGRGVWSPIEPYPTSLYSPVIIARNEDVAVGLSLDYPLFKYKHRIRTYIGRGARRESHLAKFYLDGDLAPGESRDYVVNVRFTNREDWIHTIAPYKESFARHGEVRYQQDMRPIWGMAVSDTQRISSDNPRGFRPTRADLHGWEDDVEYILDWVIPAGFERVMVWGASGMYDRARNNNFPPQFMADWTGPMVNTESQWTRIRDAGVELLFWWGRAGQYADSWNDEVLDKFEPTSPDQAHMMFDQWRLALRRGASGVGLDAFTHMDGWQAIPWVALMRALKPDATLVAEPASFDLLNLHMPTCLYSDDLVDGPHLLADYLVPGREMWVIPKTVSINHERAEEYISNGMTVLLRGRLVTAHDLQEAVERAQGGQQR